MKDLQNDHCDEAQHRQQCQRHDAPCVQGGKQSGHVQSALPSAGKAREKPAAQTLTEDEVSLLCSTSCLAWKAEDRKPAQHEAAQQVVCYSHLGAHLSVAIRRVMSRMTWFAFLSEKWISSRLFSTPSICFVCPSSVAAVSVATYCLHILSAPDRQPGSFT